MKAKATALLPTAEVARLLGVKGWTVRRVARERGIPFAGIDPVTRASLWRPEDAERLKPGPVGNPDWLARRKVPR